MDYDHEEFHAAIKNCDYVTIAHILANNIKLCQNCLLIAQDQKDSKLLCILLIYEQEEINSVDSNGDSLLIRDIRFHQCRHFYILFLNGANLNYVNPNTGFTALKYAETAACVIKDKIAHGVTKDKILILRVVFENPDFAINFPAGQELINTVKSQSRYMNYESGIVDVNNENNSTGSHFAYYCDLTSKQVTLPVELNNPDKPDFNFIKYLIEYGIDAGVKDESALKKSLNSISTVIEQSNCDDFYLKVHLKSIMPTLDFYLNLGCCIFDAQNDNVTSLAYVFGIFHSYRAVDDFLVYFIQKAFLHLPSEWDFENFDFEHPIMDVQQALPDIAEDPEVLIQIIDLILYNPNNALKHFPNDQIPADIVNTDFSWKCFKINATTGIIGKFVCLQFPLEEILNLLKKFKEENFKFEVDLLFIMIARFMISNVAEVPTDLMQVIDFLINIGIPLQKETPTHNNFHLLSSDLTVLIGKYNLPNYIWAAAAFGNIELLEKLLPYWDQNAATLLLFLRPWLERGTNCEICTETELQLLQAMIKIVPALLSVSQTVHMDTELYFELMEWLGEFEKHASCPNVEAGHQIMYKKILDKICGSTLHCNSEICSCAKANEPKKQNVKTEEDFGEKEEKEHKEKEDDEKEHKENEDDEKETENKDTETEHKESEDEENGHKDKEDEEKGHKEKEDGEDEEKVLKRRRY